jgi:hypothetical protein
VELLGPLAVNQFFSLDSALLAWFPADSFSRPFITSEERRSVVIVQQPLGQILGHLSGRLKDNVEIVQRRQQSLGERLDSAIGFGKLLKSLDSGDPELVEISSCDRKTR